MKSRNGKQSTNAIMANATNKDIQLHFFLWHRRCHAIQKYIPRIKWKEMQHNHGVGWETVLITIKKLKCRKLTKNEGLGGHRAAANQKSRGASRMNRILRRWAHLLHRASSDICGAALEYDQAHVFNLSAIICYVILTFAFGMTGKLHQAKMHFQLWSDEVVSTY